MTKTAVAAPDPDEPPEVGVDMRGPDLDIPEMGPASEDRGQPGHDLARASARRTRVVQMRLAGATYSAIAEAEGYADASAARQAVMRALDRKEADSVEDLRALENARLDAQSVIAWNIATQENLPPPVRLKALDTLLRYSTRRARLNGLDAPQAVQISAGVQAKLDDALGTLYEVVMGTVTGSRPIEQEDLDEIEAGDDRDPES